MNEEAEFLKRGRRRGAEGFRDDGGQMIISL